MNHRRWLAAACAALLMGGALAEDLPADAAYRVEARLSELGFLPGEPDGSMDDDTRVALEAFQQANGLTVSGAADEPTQAALDGGEVISRQEFLRRFAENYTQQAVLRPGDSGQEVQTLQRRLKELGFGTGKSDGVYGDATRQAVELFQLANGLARTGELDGAARMRLMADSAITWEKFLAEMTAGPGDSGLSVSALQKRLRDMGYYEGDCTGSYGDLTQQAVTRFQAANDLEPSGRADGATWARLCAADAVVLRSADTLQPGSTGERVSAAQRRLIQLGYLDGEADGTFDYATETAVRLFQLGAGELSTGLLDANGEQALLADTAVPAADESVQQTYQTLLSVADASTRDAIAQAAERLLGTSFGATADELYPGFAFVQYVCASANLPVLQPETLAAMAVSPVTDASSVLAGDIVALQGASGDSVSIRLAVGAGDGKLYYTTEEGGWVVLGFLDKLNSTNVYRWSAPGEGGA